MWVKANVARAARLRGRTGISLVAMMALMLAVGIYTSSRSAAFLTQTNINSLLLLALPLALVAIGQAAVLMFKSFDVSVGALVALGVVVASFTMAGSGWSVVPGALAVLATGLVVGLANGVLVRRVRIPSIIATLATLSILQGIALALRPVPAGLVDEGASATLVAGAGPVPYAFVAVVVLAAALDFWRSRTSSGLTAQAVGLDETSSLRLGLPAERAHWLAFIGCSLLAALAALFVAAQVGVGDPTVGAPYALQSIAAAVLGGASLAGGRVSFLGAVVGALFLSLIVNVLPLVGWSTDIGQITIGVLTLLALLMYQLSERWPRRAARPVAVAAE